MNNRLRFLIAGVVLFSSGSGLPAAAYRMGREVPSQALLAENFRLARIAPRIFAPAGVSDALNRVRFYFENPDNCEVTVRIFDITGALVKRNLDSEAENVLFWDGSDTGGNLVPGGVYIYQVEAGRKVISGTIVVAQ